MLKNGNVTSHLFYLTQRNFVMQERRKCQFWLITSKYGRGMCVFCIHHWLSLSTHSHLCLSGHNRHDLADVTALRFGASGHWWSIVYRNVCASMWERIARLFDLCQMHCQLVRVVRERGTDPREHFCARAKPVACGVPDSPALYGPVLTVFSQHQAGMIKSNHWEWLFQSCIKEWRCVSEICGASEGGLPP